MRQKLNFANTSQLLYAFERDKFGDLNDIEIDGWKVWQICKIAVFFREIQDGATSRGRAELRRPRIDQIADLMVRSGHLPFALAKTLIKSISKRSFFFTHSNDKLSKTPENKYYNNRIFPILESGSIQDFLIIETPTEDGIREPALFRHDVNALHFSILRRILKIYYSRVDRDRFTAAADRIFSLLQEYVDQRGFELSTDLAFLVETQEQFFSDRLFFRLLFKICRPRMIVSSEKMGTGLMAATVECGIELIELQHGVVDEFEPNYIWFEGFSRLAKVMKPAKLAVFGELARDLVTNKGYFDSSEVFILGDKQIERNREIFDRAGVGSRRRATLVFQPYMHELNMKILTAAARLRVQGVRMCLKAHPLQPAAEIDDYKRVAAKSNIEIIDNRESIFSVIQNSDLMIGHTTNCLYEALSVGVPSVTVSSDDLASGLHSSTGNQNLKDAILVATPEELATIVDRFYEDADFREHWLAEVARWQYYVHGADYGGNLNRIVGHEHADDAR